MTNSTLRRRIDIFVALVFIILLAGCTDQIGNSSAGGSESGGSGKIIYLNLDLPTGDLRNPLEIFLTDSAASTPRELFPWAAERKAGTDSTNPSVSEAFIGNCGRGRFVWLLADTGQEVRGGRVFVTDNATGSSTCIGNTTSDSLAAGIPVISPDGSHIAMLYGGGSTAQSTLVLYTLMTDHDSLVMIEPQIIVKADPVYSVCFSPDGTRIAYYRKSATGSMLEISNSDGSGKRTLSMLDDSALPALDETFSLAPCPIAWSSAGDEIAYQKSKSLQVIRADGSASQEVDASGAAPDWSPDGKTLAYLTSSGVADRQRILLTPDLGLTKHELLGKNNPTLWGGQWSPDGKKVLCSTGGPRLDMVDSLEVIDVATGAARVLGSPGCGARWLR